MFHIFMMGAMEISEGDVHKGEVRFDKACATVGLRVCMLHLESGCWSGELNSVVFIMQVGTWLQ